ncbi:Retrovirus-related Pol polyprotein from transposon TNT 1-94 [Senna tora]|uniref:Retrovirus-related Pol polyprotein from transposon TNT 1-94 n=1 Tax=Senna tora TaxID=362788 RepID=A0A834XAW9_9FABA|nr:Retrovirus-related Pol polyprotein from transposon TNT 1-94 [Senna tora]
MHCQDTSSDPHSHEKGNTALNLAISDVCPDEILSPPIAKRKGVRSYTLHPISQFVSYEKLSPKFQAFVSNLDKEFPYYIQLREKLCERFSSINLVEEVVAQMNMVMKENINPTRKPSSGK